MARERWTDEQLDKAFGRINGDLRELRVEMRKGFEQIDQRFEQMNERFEQVDKRFEQVDKRFDEVARRFDTMFSWFAGLSCAVIGSLVAGIVAVVSLG